ncbi:hypothetical protein ACLEJQ_04980 [Pseudomonas sp. SMV71]|uniref:hypothetical protein n=1 Tax=Pseudomonas sp. SMV71 TaxID=3390195 RepID=UPI003F834F6E
MSTLNEIAANHARMAKAKEEESIRLGELHGQVVGGFEVACVEVKQAIPLPFMVTMQEQTFGEGAAA